MGWNKKKKKTLVYISKPMSKLAMNTQVGYINPKFVHVKPNHPPWNYAKVTSLLHNS